MKTSSLLRLAELAWEKSELIDSWQYLFRWAGVDGRLIRGTVSEILDIMSESDKQELLSKLMEVK